MQNCSRKYICLKNFLRLLLGGVGWGFGTMFARQGDIVKIVVMIVVNIFVKIVQNLWSIFLRCISKCIPGPGTNIHRDDHSYHWGASHHPRQVALLKRWNSIEKIDKDLINCQVWLFLIVPVSQRTTLYSVQIGPTPLALNSLSLSGAVLGNVLAEAPERLTALSRQQLKEVGSSSDLIFCVLKGLSC